MKSILFKTDEVRAILDGRKTVTRRVMKPQPEMDEVGMWQWKTCQWMDGGLGFPQSGIEDYAPYQTGDVLYVRETWNFGYFESGGDEAFVDHWFEEVDNVNGFMKDRSEYFYRASTNEKDTSEFGMKWKPSIHMPREAARIFLSVTDVRVERIQDISVEDTTRDFSFDPEAIKAVGRDVLVQGAWDSTIKPADRNKYGWDANPWGWVIAFERISREETDHDD